MSKKLKHIAPILIIIVGLLVRFWKMEYIPFQSDGDELGYVFAGMSLVQKNTPISWSGFGGYTNWHRLTTEHLGRQDLSADGDFDFVIPWFDHPFLLPLIEGTWTTVFGYSFPTIPPSFIIRVPTLILASLTLYLVYRISKELFGYKAGLFSLIAISFSPSFVFIHRMVVGENVYVPVILAAVWLLITHQDKLWTLIGLSLIAGFAKITGLVIVPIIVIFQIINRQYKRAAIYGLTTLAFFALIYCLYGAFLDWNVFVSIFKTQSYRLIGWSNPAFIFSVPGFTTTRFYDMSYYAILLLGFAPFITNRWENNNENFLFLTILTTFALIWLTGSEQDALGWYKLPLFTFLVISLGKMVKKITSESLMIVSVVTVLNNYGLIKFPNHPLPSTETLRLSVGLPFAIIFLLVIFSLPSAAKIKKAFIAIAITIYMFESLYIADKFYEASCKDRTCPHPEITSRQLINQFITPKHSKP